MRSFVLSTALVVGCGAPPKTPEPGIDFGDLTSDSARYPARVDSIALGEIRSMVFTSRERYFGFVFDGEKGQRIDAFLDGLDGIDTVLYLYRSTAGGRPSGRALVSNDDSDGSW